MKQIHEKIIGEICSKLESLVLHVVKNPEINRDSESEGSGSDYYFFSWKEELYLLPCKDLNVEIVLRDYSSTSSSGTYSSMGGQSRTRSLRINDISNNNLFYFEKSLGNSSIYSSIGELFMSSKSAGGWRYTCSEADIKDFDRIAKITDDVFKLYKS